MIKVMGTYTTTNLDLLIGARPPEGFLYLTSVDPWWSRNTRIKVRKEVFAIKYTGGRAVTLSATILRILDEDGTYYYRHTGIRPSIIIFEIGGVVNRLHEKEFAKLLGINKC